MILLGYLAHIDWFLRLIIEVAVACASVANVRLALELYRRGNPQAGRERAFSAAGFALILVGSLVSAAWLFGDGLGAERYLPAGLLLPIGLIALGFVLLALAAVFSLRNNQTGATVQPEFGERTTWPPPPNT